MQPRYAKWFAQRLTDSCRTSLIYRKPSQKQTSLRPKSKSISTCRARPQAKCSFCPPCCLLLSLKSQQNVQDLFDYNLMKMASLTINDFGPWLPYCWLRYNTCFKDCTENCGCHSQAMFNHLALYNKRWKKGLIIIEYELCPWYDISLTPLCQKWRQVDKILSLWLKLMKWSQKKEHQSLKTRNESYFLFYIPRQKRIFIHN